MDNWMDTCGPCIDHDSLHPAHQGAHSIPPFQTHSRYFYAPLGEECCGRRFVNLYYQQYHPFPHCPDCSRMVLGLASLICWQCRTYFRRYSTGTMQQMMGVTPQRHSSLEVLVPERGLNQRRLPEEQTAQDWRDGTLGIRPLSMLERLLPRETTCQFWINVTEYLEQLGNRRILINLPTVPMPYFNEEALLPLPPSPGAGFRTGLSLHSEVIEANIPADLDTESAPMQE